MWGSCQLSHQPTPCLILRNPIALHEAKKESIRTVRAAQNRRRVPQVRPSVGLTWVSPTSWDGRVPHTSQVLACVGLLTFMLAHANAGATKSPVPLRGTAEESPAFQRWASTNRSHSSLPKACAQSPSRSAHNTIRSALFAPIRSRLVSTDN